MGELWKVMGKVFWKVLGKYLENIGKVSEG